jgi:hypothetical protein
MTRDRKNTDRWGLLTALDVGADGDPYLDRLRVVQTPLFGLYLHHIHRADIEADPHDHPWWFASIVLAGSYAELVWPDKRDGSRARHRDRRRWSLRRMGLGSSHIITRVDGPLWTLVLTGPKRASWGFWRSGQFTPWKDYQFAGSGDS